MTTVKKITFEELSNSYKEWEEAVIVITEDSFTEKYSIESRSYLVSSKSKIFDPMMLGSSLVGNSLDETDLGVRLDLYLDSWKIDYCYIVK